MLRFRKVHMVTVLVALVALISSSGLTAGPVSADDTVCTSTLILMTVDNVFVPAGAICTLRGVTVTGNVEVEGALVARDSGAGTPTTIDGNVQGDPAQIVQIIEGTVVEGSVQIKGTASPPFVGNFNVLCGSTIRGDLQFEDNGRFILIGAGLCAGFGGGSTVDGNVQIEKNTGGATIAGNTIGGDLQCKDNMPAAIDSGQVSIGGNDEC